MGIANTKHKLPANRMIFDVRRNRALYANFAEDLEKIMEKMSNTYELPPFDMIG